MNLDGCISKEKQKLCGPYEKMQETIGNRNLHVQKYLGLIRFCISSYSLCYHQHNRAKRMRVTRWKNLIPVTKKIWEKKTLKFCGGVGLCGCTAVPNLYPSHIRVSLVGSNLGAWAEVKGLFGQGRIVFPVQLDWVIEVRSSYHS